ncbi:hypothetical protein RSSM_03222 [Rhodopirellula sallentina SM41]|uniref:Uncharacterized protein n=1 Tax=Rhodopirellula sallentina SM41 TaxID=1263870 RepID=M5UBT9_9BACT|nr:hypothetical protein RSSM_03222 [Rhodopirellula sallentina SM41]
MKNEAEKTQRSLEQIQSEQSQDEERAFRNAESIENAQALVEKAKRMSAAIASLGEKDNELHDEAKAIAESLRKAVRETVDKVASQLAAVAQNQESEMWEDKPIEPEVIENAQISSEKKTDAPKIKRSDQKSRISSENVDNLDNKLSNQSTRGMMAAAKEGQLGKNSLTITAHVLAASDIELTRLLKGFSDPKATPQGEHHALGQLISNLAAKRMRVTSVKLIESGNNADIAILDEDPSANEKCAEIYEHVFFLKAISRLRDRLEATESMDEYLPPEEIASKFADGKATLEDVELALVRSLINAQDTGGGWGYQKETKWSSGRNPDMSLTQSALFGIRSTLEHNGKLNKERLLKVYGTNDETAAVDAYVGLLRSAHGFAQTCAPSGFFQYRKDSVGTLRFSSGNLLSCVPVRIHDGTLRYPNSKDDPAATRVALREAVRRAIADHQRMIGTEGWTFTGKLDVDFPYHYQTLYTARSLVMFLQVSRSEAAPDVRTQVEDWTDSVLSQYLAIASDSEHPFAPLRPPGKSFSGWINGEHQSMKTMSRIVATTLRDDLRALLNTTSQ